jgi:hypothetical protein
MDPTGLSQAKTPNSFEGKGREIPSSVELDSPVVLFNPEASSSLRAMNAVSENGSPDSILS